MKTMQPIKQGTERQYFLDHMVPRRYRHLAARKVQDSDWRVEDHGSFTDTYSVEYSEHEPGALESYPCLVWCVRCSMPGCITNRTYEPLS